jgi:hypothetical protein
MDHDVTALGHNIDAKGVFNQGQIAMGRTGDQRNQAWIGEGYAAFLGFATTRHEGFTNSPVREFGMVPMIRTV